jgi:hypothetical protein
MKAAVTPAALGESIHLGVRTHGEAIILERLAPRPLSGVKQVHALAACPRP